MLGLLSRIVIGGDSEDQRAKEEANAYHSSPGTSCCGDTDEELYNSPMPTINIDRTELAQEAKESEKDDFLTSSEQTDSLDGAGDSSALEEKHEELAPVVIPSRDVCRRIVELVEYYLGDANLVKDMFLLKHVTKHREGFVSLKLLTSYKKVKRLTKDWRVVAHSLKSSNNLELNNDETKVRRRNSLPPELEEDTRPFRTLLATHISQEKSNMNQLADFFGRFGEMISLQVHKPGGRTLNEVRLAEKECQGISSTICALVEYEKVHCARQALRYITNNSEESGMKIMEVPRRKRDGLLGVRCKAESESAYYSNSDLSEPSSPVYQGRYPLQRLRTTSSSLASSPCASPIIKRRNANGNNSSPESSPPSLYHYNYGHSSPCSSPEEVVNHPRPYDCNDFFPVFQSYNVPGSLPLPRRRFPHSNTDFRIDSPRPKSRNAKKPHQENTLMPLSPWLRRRAFNNSSDGASPFSSPSSSPNLRRRMDSPMLVPDNVMRFPKGPDGTKGFTKRRTCLIQASA